MPVISSRVTRSYKWLGLPTDWDAGWRAARATVATAPAYVAVIGDSNAQGQNTTDHMTKSFPRLLRNSLVAKYGSYGDYWSVAHSARYMTVLGGPAPLGIMPFAFDTTWGISGGLNFNAFGTHIMQDGGGTYPVAWVNAGSGSFLTPYACTDIDIIYHDWNSASTWKYNVDNAAGAGLVTVTNDARNSIRRASLTGLSNAVHTVRVGNPSAIYALNLNGVVTYDPTNIKTRGVGFANISASSLRLYDWQASTNSMPDDRIRQWQGRYKTAPATTLETGFGFPTQPHLAIIELGINDCLNPGGLVQFRAGLRRMVEALRRGRDNCSIIFVICPNPVTGISDTTTQFTRAESWSLYADQIYGIASEYQCAVYNAHADWVPTSVAQGFTTSNDPHPTDLGHQHIANILASVIV